MRFGMDYGGTNLKVGLFTDSGEVVAFEETPLRRFLEAGDLLEALLAHAAEFTRGHPIDSGGLAIKGLVDTRRGIIEEDIGAGNLLAGVALRDAFAEALNVPFWVDNDARAYAWGEWLFGAGRGAAVLVSMTLGTGIGCALVVHGALYEGADPLGGILGGHITIDRHGPECTCGHRGCLELYCSAPALAARIRQAHPEITADDPLPAFCQVLSRDDAPVGYRETLGAFQSDLALGIVNVIHAYGPDRVVLGGGIMGSSHLILPGVVEEVHRRAWTVPRRRVEIRAAALGNRAAAMGIAFHPAL